MVRCSTSNHGSAVAHGGVILRLFHRVFNAWKCNSPNNDLLELKSIDACASLKSRKPDAESKSGVVEVARSTSHQEHVASRNGAEATEASMEYGSKASGPGVWPGDFADGFRTLRTDDRKGGDLEKKIKKWRKKKKDARGRWIDAQEASESSQHK